MTGEAADLRAARARKGELETEVAATRRASELFDEGRVVRPNVRHPIVAQLASDGHSLPATCRLFDLAPSGYSFDGPDRRGRSGFDRLGSATWQLKCCQESRWTSETCRMRVELAVNGHGQVVNLKPAITMMWYRQIAG